MKFSLILDITIKEINNSLLSLKYFKLEHSKNLGNTHLLNYKNHFNYQYETSYFRKKYLRYKIIANIRFHYIYFKYNLQQTCFMTYRTTF